MAKGNSGCFKSSVSIPKLFGLFFFEYLKKFLGAA
jgi:hypothetical protein